MKKRLLSLLIAGVMSAGLLSGCAASEDTQDQSDQVQIQKQMRRIRQTAVHQLEKRWWYIIPQQEIPKQWQITLRMLQEEIYLNWSR